MSPYLLEYVAIFIVMCYHIYWNMSSYLFEYAIIFIGIYHHIYWNMYPYLLEYVSIFIGICIHIYWNMSSIYLLLNSNSDKKLHPKHYKRKISIKNISKEQQKH